MNLLENIASAFRTRESAVPGEIHVDTRLINCRLSRGNVSLQAGKFKTNAEIKAQVDYFRNVRFSADPQDPC